MSKVVKTQHCKICGAEQINVLAPVRWDTDNQKWVISEPPTHFESCEFCDRGAGEIEQRQETVLEPGDTVSLVGAPEDFLYVVHAIDKLGLSLTIYPDMAPPGGKYIPIPVTARMLNLVKGVQDD